jgi:hypothetical protein
MATTLATLPLQADAWRVYIASSPEDQQKISETVSNIIVDFSSMGSNRLANSALYEHDFFEWVQTTVSLIKAGKWYEIDAHSLAEELNDLGVSQYNAVSSDLYQVLMHLLQWQYQAAMRVDSHSWRDSIAEHRHRIDRLCTRMPSPRTHLPAMLVEEYPRARRRASMQTNLPLATFPEACPWELGQILDDDFWPEEAGTQGKVS